MSLVRYKLIISKTNQVLSSRCRWVMLNLYSLLQKNLEFIGETVNQKYFILKNQKYFIMIPN